MNKTEDILERLKGQMPQVPDGDLLTESIMQAITTADKDKPVRIVPLWVRVMRVVSSAAAVFFIALFIGLNGEETESVAEMPVVAPSISGPAIKDKSDAIKLFNDRIERRKARKIRQTQFKNLYAKI